MSENESESEIEARASDLERHYRGVSAVVDKRPIVVAATDLRHALGMESPAGSLNKTVCARFVATCDDDEETPADALEAMHTAAELRERVAETAELESVPSSLGPVIYDLMAHIEDAESDDMGALAVENAHEEEEYEESYYEEIDGSDDE